MRGKPEKFADHYSQATLFWNSQTPYEKAHIVRGFRFELTKVQVPAIRERTVSMLRNVSDELAQPVADGLGLELPSPMPRVIEPPKSEVKQSPALSLTARPGDGSIRGRRIAILVAPGVDGDSVATAQKALTEAEAVVRLVAARLGAVETADGRHGRARRHARDDAVGALRRRRRPGWGEGGHGARGARAGARVPQGPVPPLQADPPAGAGAEVAKAAGVPTDDRADWAVVRDVRAFIGAVGKHRNWDRATDPPRV